MKKISSIIFILIVLHLWGCEDPYTPSTSTSQQEIVVEGFVEAGEGALPVIVLVTRSIPFISTIGSDVFGDIFVRDAVVEVFDGTNTISLTQLCLSDIPEELREEAAQLLGLNVDSLSLDICIYADITNQINRKAGGRYDLTVQVDEKILTATTTIPQIVELTDFDFRVPPGIPIDSMAELWANISDPAGMPNYYRYFTATGDDPQLIAPFGSVFDDGFFDGMQNLPIPFPRAQRRGQDFNPDTFGLYQRGDSIRIKFCTIDFEHYDFWRTRDFAANSGGPFSSYTRISSNIKGGLGIWGGYAVTNYSLYVPPR